MKYYFKEKKKFFFSIKAEISSISPPWDSPGFRHSDSLAIFWLLSIFWQGQIRPVLIIAENNAPSARTVLDLRLREKKDILGLFLKKGWKKTELIFS